MKPPMPRIVRGDARDLPLPDNSVDLICTSPPYFGLRSYTDDGGERYEGQLGSEATPAEFIDALIECTREMVRVLKPSGSIFLNLGDKYSGAQAQNYNDISNRRSVDSAKFWRQTDLKRTGIPNKSLMLLPERYRIACVDQLGLIARAVIVWAKPNGLPESVTDRVRRSHEDWVHLTVQPRYFAAVDEIREQYELDSLRASKHSNLGMKARNTNLTRTATGAYDGPNPLGKLPGSVWEIATQPLKVPASLGVDHFAAQPMAWPRRLIQGWCPREVCSGCGEGRRPVTVRASAERHNGGRHDLKRYSPDNNHGVGASTVSTIPDYRITGYACACPDTTAPTTPGIVLDPFSGTGTTALVATMLGRTGIGVDLSADYNRLAEWRANDPKERARAAGLDPDEVAAIRPQLPGQGSLLDLLDGGAS